MKRRYCPGGGVVSTRKLFHLALYLGCVVALVAGCGRAKQTGPSARSARPVEDSLEAARQLLHKSPDLAAAQGAVQKVNAYLSTQGDAEVRSAIVQSQQLRNQQGNPFGLNAEDIEEVDNSSFTLLDGHHLEMCFVLRDAMQSLEVEGRPPVEQASAAFEWVVRQVRLIERGGPALPPVEVLRRGRGTAIERAMVFLAAALQLGVDGCLVRCPVAGQADQAVWLVGMVVDKDVYLFDPGLGLAMPGGTIAELRAKPERLKALTVDAKYPYPVDAKSVEKAEVFPVSFLSAQAPRMKFLEEWLSPEIAVRLWADPLAQRDRLENALRGSGTVLGTWTRRPELPNPLRLLASFLPPEEGGTDRTYRMKQSLAELSPPAERLPRLVQTWVGDPHDRLVNAFNAGFRNFFTNPKQAPEQMVRGHFDEALVQLVGNRTELKSSQGTREADLEKRLSEWYEGARSAHADLLRAQKAAAGPLEKDADVQEAQRRVDEVWKQGKEPLAQLLAAAMAEPLGAEMTFRVALIKQEQAERLQAKMNRLGRPLTSAEAKSVRDAWNNAVEWWLTFTQEYPGGAAASRALHARALEALGDRKAAIALLEDLSGRLTTMDKIARLYRAQQLKMK